MAGVVVAIASMVRYRRMVQRIDRGAELAGPSWLAIAISIGPGRHRIGPRNPSDRSSVIADAVTIKCRAWSVFIWCRRWGSNPHDQ